MSQKKPVAPKRSNGSSPRGPHPRLGTTLGTVSGPSTLPPPAPRPLPTAPGAAALDLKQAGTEELAAAQPFNEAKPAEYAADDSEVKAPEGESHQPSDPIVGSSTVQEGASSPKVGSGKPELGVNPTNAPLDRVRVDSTRPAAHHQPGRADRRQPELAQGRPARADAAGGLHPPREDHPLRPRAHPRARRARARLGGARLLRVLRAADRAHARALFAEAGKRTPVFVRFSTVAGERGSTDTARDVRGFAVKFYTDEGNWDLVGNNIPVFFIQDAMKFPDLVHAAKPEPHHAMPQAASAHDTFWDFVSLMPESTHMLMWVMSDRAIPRSYRMMQGFGVHTFRLRQRGGRVELRASSTGRRWPGTHSLDWDEAVKISGADPDFHRRDLWEAIEAGAFPEWELGSRSSPRSRPKSFSFDVLDADQARARGARAGAAGRPDGARTATPTTSSPRPSRWRSAPRTSCPGIDFSNDPLLPGRIHSTWTRRSRAWAARTSTRSRSTRRSRRSTTTSATACTARPSTRPRRLRAELAGRRLSVPGGRDAASPRSRQPIDERQGARQAGEVRRPLHAGDAVLEQPDARREGAHRRAPSASS